MEPIGASTAVTGLRMIWTGMRWLWHSRQAPWSAVPLSATMSPYIEPWHDVKLFGTNEKPFAIEILSVRTIRPKGLRLRRADSTTNPGMRPDTESKVLESLKWSMPEIGVGIRSPFERHVFVNLEGLRGNVVVDFELMVCFLDNRRSELPVWVRTNTINRP
jgi:hypothetical protein